MKRNVILLLLVIVLLTGCNIKYDLLITDTEQVNEEFTIPVKNKDILKKYKTVDEYLDYYSNLYSMNEGYDKFMISTKKGREISKFIVNRKYKNLDDFITSYSFKSMFDNASIERVGNYVKFTTSNNKYLQQLKSKEDIDENSIYESFQVNIKFYNKVVDSNADRIDEKNNIYTWEIVSDNPKDFIMFKISKDKRYDVMILDYIFKNLVAFVFFGTVIVLGILLLLFVNYKRLKNDRI